MKTILITGGAGFIGSSLAETLLKKEKYRLVIADDLSTGDISKLPQGFSHDVFAFYTCDVNVQEQLQWIFKKEKIDIIFHYAAMVGVKRTLANPLGVLRDIDGLKNIFEMAVKHNVEKVFFSSSSEVYGEPVEIPQNETTTPLNSRLPYAIVKNVGEAFCRSYFQTYGLKFTIFRFFNTYGPKQSKDFVVSKFINAALKNEPITIYGDGTQTRTFCYIDDNVDACIEIFEKGYYENDVVNIGNDKETSILELAQKIVMLTNSNSEIRHLPPLPEGDMSRRKPDITKMRKVLNRPLIDLNEGIKRILQNPKYILL